VACTNGALFALGRHDYGRLGIGRDKKDAIVPELSPLFDGVNKKVFKVATGPATTLAISTNYELYGWGMVTNNQLPIPGITEDLYEPHRLQVSGQALDVSVGAQHALIIVKS
jgi:regulator of chromosome condensation